MEGATYHDPSEKEKKAINLVYGRYHDMLTTRARRYRYFNDRTLLEYIDDNTRRWNGYIPPRDDLTMDWQARVFNNFTRNVTINFLSKVALNRPKAKIVATNNDGFEDTLRAHILSKLLEHADKKENGEWKFFQVGLEQVTKGTVVTYEGFRKIKRKVKEVVKYDPTTGKFEYDEKEILDYNDPYAVIIPLEDFFIGNIWQPDMQLQPDVLWRQIVRSSEAEEEFRKYANWSHVKPGNYTTDVTELPFYKERLSMVDIETDQVEILRYFNRLKDRMVIIANGVVLYDGPIPFAHKKYPFASTIYEPFAIDFFYGKSLPDKIATDQDVINTLWNMMLDQSYLSIFKPILNDDPDDDEETVLIPGLVKKVNNKESYRVLSELTGPDSGHFNILQFAMRFAQDNSGSMTGGAAAQTPHGGKVTARQALMQEEQTRSVLGLSAKMLEKWARDASELRLKVILQFATIPEKVEDITGKKDAMKMFYRTLRLDGTELSDGTHGTAFLRFAKSDKNLPLPDDIAVEETAAAMQGKNIEIHAVTPDYIRNVDFDVQIIPESSYLQNKSIEQALGMEFIQMATGNPVIAPLMNPEELAREFLAINEKDPDRFMKGPAMGPQGMGGMPPGMPPELAALMGGQGGMPPGAPNQMPKMGASGAPPPVSKQINGSANPKALGSMLETAR